MPADKGSGNIGFRWTIRTKLVAAFVALTALPLFALGHLANVEVARQTRSFMENAALQEMEHADRFISLFIQEYKEDVNDLASRPVFRRLDGTVTSYMDKRGDAAGLVKQTPLANGGLEAELYVEMERFRIAHPKVYFMSVAVAENGGYVQSPATTRRAGYDPRVRPWYRLAADNPDRVMVTDPYLTSNGEALEISFVRTLRDDTGRVAGVVSVDITLQGLSDRVKDVRIGQSGYVVLTDSRGIIIAHPHRPELVFKDIGAVMAGMRDASGALRQGEWETLADGRPTVARVATATATDWRIYAFVDKAEVLSGTEAFRRKMLVAAVLILLLVAGAGTILARRITQPVSEVVTAAEAIAAGDLSAPRRLARWQNSEDEVGVLVNTITGMADKIELSFKEVAESTERRVVAEQLKLQNEYLSLLHETALTLMDQLDADRALRMILASAARLVGTEHGFIFLVDRERGVFVRRMGTGIYERDIGREMPLSEGVAGQVYRTGNPVVVEDYHSLQNPYLSVAILPERRSVTQVPLKAGGEVVGSLGVAHVEAGRVFGQAEVEVLSRFAELASIALANARLHTALSVSQGQNEALIAAIPDTMLRCRIDGLLLDVRPGTEASAWRLPDRAAGRAIGEVLPGRLAARIVRQAKAGGSRSFEYRQQGSPGTEWEVRITASGPGECLVILRNMTARKEMERRLEFLSLRDGLTGLYNRRYFEDEMRRAGGRRSFPAGIVMCDVDGLKIINDSLGHECGDQLLIAAAGLLRAVFTTNAVVARVGGDEFAVLLTKTSKEAVEEYCRQFRAAVERYNEEHPRLPLSVSVGSAAGGGRSVDLPLLFREADDHMYREKLHRTTSIRGSIVQALMKALEARDYVTQGHADRMLAYAAKLAEKAGLPERAVADIRLLAQFHDIGKVGIPDRILFKPGRLTPREMAEMRRHPEIGYRIALSIPELIPVADWILKHQEWWNGQGYPLGLKGEEIPLACRLVAVVDAFDAMTSDRPYRKALSRAEAVAELVRCRGSQFDPGLVDAFLAVLAEEDGEV